MFKLFRKYNRFLLAIFGSLLMVVFLIDMRGGSSFFQPSQAKQAVGTADGQKITYGDLQQAQAELSVLNRFPVMPLPVGKDDALGWVLLMREANRLGLKASQGQVNDILNELGYAGNELFNLAADLRVQPDLIRLAVNHWIIAHDYQALVAGITPTPAVDAVRYFALAMQTMDDAAKQVQQLRRQGNVTPEAQYRAFIALSQARQRAELMATLAQGNPRVSAPMLAHFVHDLGSSVRITALPVGLDRFKNKAAPPDTRDLVAVFDQYKNYLPGQGKPFRFGFKIPDRVKLEYLAVPFDRVLATIQVDEADALEYYQRHQAEFRVAPSTRPASGSAAPTVQPYLQVRDTIIDELRHQRAADLADRMIKDAQSMLLDSTSRLPEEAGYRVFPRGFKSLPLSEVAAKLQAKYGILCDVVRHDGSWLTHDDLQDLPGLGASHIYTGSHDARSGASLAEYALATRELSPSENNPLLTLRLQVGVTSVPMVDADGSRYLFRLLAAEPARVPKSYDADPAVLRAVVDAAEKIAAYNLLLADRSRLLAELRKVGPTAMALGLKVKPVTADFRRREMDQGGPTVPYVAGIGSSATFVDAVFSQAEKAARLAAGKPITTVPVADRTLAVPLDTQLTLYLVTLNDYKPMTQQEYDDALAGAPQILAWIHDQLPASNPTDKEFLAMLKKRTGYQEAGNHKASD